MRSEHVRFEEMSDLCDEAIATEEERDNLLEHIENCSDCRIKFNMLKQTLSYCVEFRGVHYPLNNLPSSVLGTYRFRRRKKMLFKSMPAVAASVLLIVGISIYDAGTFSPKDGASFSMSESDTVSTDSQAVLNIIRKHNATIVNVNDLYIEGRVPISNFQSLRKELGFRDVTYRLIERTRPDPVNPWSSNYKEVGTGQHGYQYRELTSPPSSSGKYVLFRVFR